MKHWYSTGRVSKDTNAGVDSRYVEISKELIDEFENFVKSVATVGAVQEEAKIDASSAD